MPFLDKSISLTRLEMLDTPHQGAFADAVDNLRRHCFQPIDELPEEIGYGWTNIDDLLDAHWQASPPQKGDYLAFSLRIDKRSVPPAALDKEYRKALAEEEAHNREIGKKFITRERKKELKDQVKIRLLRRAVPVPKVIDAVVDAPRGLVYLTSTNAKEIELFCDFFQRSFDIALGLFDFYYFANAVFPDKNLDALENIPFGAGSQAHELLAGHLLGRDFLTFLWFYCENHGGLFRQSAGNDFSINLGDSVTVTDVDASKVTASAGNNLGDTLSEAKLGIAKGKKVSAAKLRLERDSETYSCKLEQGAGLTALRCPPIDLQDNEDPDGLFLERLYLVEAFYKMLDAAFVQFLQARLDPDTWQTVVARINLWLQLSVNDDNKSISTQSSEHTDRLYNQWLTHKYAAADLARWLKQKNATLKLVGKSAPGASV